MTLLDRMEAAVDEATAKFMVVKTIRLGKTEFAEWLKVPIGKHLDPTGAAHRGVVQVVPMDADTGIEVEYEEQ